MKIAKNRGRTLRIDLGLGILEILALHSQPRSKNLRISAEDMVNLELKVPRICDVICGPEHIRCGVPLPSSGFWIYLIYKGIGYLQHCSVADCRCLPEKAFVSCLFEHEIRRLRAGDPRSNFAPPQKSCSNFSGLLIIV